jgi:homoserine dehydrogenase
MAQQEITQSVLRVGLLGLGTVGTGVADFLLKRGAGLAELFGCGLVLQRVLIRDPMRTRAIEIAPETVTTDVRDILQDPAIDVVVEVIGGEEPAHQYIRQALEHGKHLVTANKEVMAKHGLELVNLAAERDCDLYYEASVGGGLPLIGPFKRDLIANRISGIRAIINGTTNYILTRMAHDGTSFADALAQAQALGYAEPDPHNDVAGIDAGYKLAILATLGFHTPVFPTDVYQEGIEALSPKDFTYAASMGYAIKLLGIARETDGAVEARVHPALVPLDFLLARVDGVYNAVELQGDLVGRVVFYGRGAGSAPTSSAIIADLLDLARNVRKGISNRTATILGPRKPVRSIDDVSSRFYLRMEVRDHPGVLAKVANIMAESAISISAVIQQEADETSGTAEIVITTHHASGRAMSSALLALQSLDDVNGIPAFIRIEHVPPVE